MRVSSSHRRYAFLILALLLVAAVAGIGSTSFQRQLEAFQPLGFTVQAQLGAWVVAEVVTPETGLLPGDEILLVHGETAGHLEKLEEQLRSNQVAEILVKRGEGLEQVTYQRPGLDIDGSYLILVAIGVFYLLIGFYTAFKDPQASARLFFFWCLVSAALYLLSPILPVRDAIDRWIYLLDQAARLLLPALTLHLFLVFPSRFLRPSWQRLAIPFVYLPAALLTAFHLEQALWQGRFLFGPATTAVFQRVDRLELVMLVALPLLAAVTLAIRFSRPEGWQQYRQLLWVLIGLLAGYLPFLVLNVTPFVLGWAWPGWLTLIGVLPLILVPLTFAYAILKYKLWDIGIILRDSIAYSLTALIGLLGFSLINLLIQRGLTAEMTLARNMLAFTAGLAIAGVMVPTRGAIAAGLEKLQYRGHYGHRNTLNELGYELLRERDLEPLCRTLTDGLTEGLAVPRICLYLAQSGSLIPFEPDSEVPSRLDLGVLGENFWGRDVEAISAIALPGQEPSAAQQFFVAGYRYAFPLIVRGCRVGLVLLSYKEADVPLNSEDIDLARGLLNQAALALENARLLEEVQRQLAEVTELKEHNRGIIESSPAGLAVLDDDEQIVLSNQAFAALASAMGVSRSIMGRKFEDIIPVRPLPVTGSGALEVGFCDVSGQEHYLLISQASYQERPGRHLSIVVVQDISEQIGLEMELKEKEQLASLGMLAAGVAHEVNTPITGISSYAQLLLAETGKGDPHYPILKKMERQTFRAAQIVNNLLEFSRNRRSEHEAVRLQAVIHECCQMLAERASEAGVVITTDSSEEQLAVVGREGELAQVFNNLLTNAIDAMAGKGGRITLDTTCDGDRATVRLVDTGPGIAPERLERIFQPFFSSKLNHGGTGLGLAISYNIVRRHGGEIWAENNSPGPGCAFTVVLRRYQGQTNAR